MRANGRSLRGIVLDAGPLIALAHRGDPDHATARAGFDALVGQRTRQIAVFPVVCEVYKWLLYHSDPSTARDALTHMRTALEILFPGKRDFDDATALINGLSPRWMGTLEDALVAAAAVRLRLPAWTLNYRDFSAFRRLELWGPPGR